MIKINKTVIFSFANLFLKSISLLLLTPFLVGNLDDSSLFIWYFLVTIYSIVMLLDLGFLPTISRYTTKLANTKYMYSIISLSKRIYLFLSTFTFIFILLFSSFYLKGKSGLQLPESSFYFLIVYIFICSFSLYANVYASMLHGLDEIIEIQIAQIIGSFIGISFSLCSLLLYGNVFITAISFYFGQILVFLYLRLKFKCRLENISFNERIEQTIFSRKILISDSLKSGFGILLSLGVLHMASLFVTYDMGVVESAAYLFLVQIFRAIISFSQPIFYTRIPSINRMYNESGSFKYVTDYAKPYIFYSVLFYLFLVVISYLFCEIYFYYFDEQSLRSDLSTWTIFMVAFFIERICSMLLQLYTSTGKVIWHKINGLTGVVIMICISAFYLSNNINVSSYPISVFISYFFFFFPIIIYISLKEAKIVNKK